jgi:hypothetical protein
MHDNNNLNKIDKKQPKSIKHFKSKYIKKEKPDSESVCIRRLTTNK